MKGVDLYPKDHSMQLFTDASNEGWGTHLEQASTKGLWSDREKRLHTNALELKAVSLALQRFKDQCQNQTVLVATDNSTGVAYKSKKGGTHSADVRSPVEDHDLVPSLPDNLKSQTHSRVSECDGRPTVQVEPSLNVMADLLSRSNQVQSTEWSLHPQVFKQICLLATRLNHKVPLYVSPVPDQYAWEHKLVMSHLLNMANFDQQSKKYQ